MRLDDASRPGSKRWYRRDPRSSPIGLVALAIGILGCGAYVAGVALPIARGTIAGILDSSAHNAEVMIAIVASGVAVLLSILSLALERAPLPSLLCLFLLVAIENVLFPMMPIWTLMVAPWELGLLYALAFLAALVLVIIRLAKKMAVAR